MMSKKRKIYSECRIFKEQWTYDYFFMQYKEKAVCLICQNSVSVFKEYNLRRHYQTQNKDKYDCLVSDVRKDKILKLKNTLTTQQNTFVKRKQLNISSLRASFQVAKLIACTGRPFVEGEFVKECLLSVAKEMCPEKADLFSTDSELLIIIFGINENFEVTEELAALQSIKGTTTGEDIYEKVSQTVKDLELDWAKLASVTTDGAPSMVGSKKGVIARINQEMEPVNNRTKKANALNHRQFQKFMSELNVAHEDAVYHTEVRLLSRGRVLRHFYDLLPQNSFYAFKNKEVPELNDQCRTGLKRNPATEWAPEEHGALSGPPKSTGPRLGLSGDHIAAVSSPVSPDWGVGPTGEILGFPVAQSKPVNDAEWKSHLALLKDVTELLNSFNVQLQGKWKLICDMQSHVKAFEVKLGLLIKQVKEENFCHLPLTENLLAEKRLIPFPKETENLQKEFQLRFKELHLYEQDIQLFRKPIFN
ncbi:general transcription factor II-I repeat domain-containing protein 2-like [Dendropsophus ebraccatus]|uniref:general transcription factor II-I repeat domain-containing protein 2-like n=1 Tax=Dendropsophus ebraccatus TaxID=150705 RepID=UPI0038321AD5